jgi:hypothetical protein
MAASMRISPVRRRENSPLETPKSSVRGLTNTLRVLDRWKAQTTWERKPTPTMYQP